MFDEIGPPAFLAEAKAASPLSTQTLWLRQLTGFGAKPTLGFALVSSRVRFAPRVEALRLLPRRLTRVSLRNNGGRSRGVRAASLREGAAGCQLDTALIAEWRPTRGPSGCSVSRATNSLLLSNKSPAPAIGEKRLNLIVAGLHAPFASVVHRVRRLVSTRAPPARCSAGSVGASAEHQFRYNHLPLVAAHVVAVLFAGVCLAPADDGADLAANEGEAMGR